MSAEIYKDKILHVYSEDYVLSKDTLKEYIERHGELAKNDILKELEFDIKLRIDQLIDLIEESITPEECKYYNNKADTYYSILGLIQSKTSSIIT